MRERLALIVAILLTFLFVKNIVLNALGYRALTAPYRDVLLQF